MSILGYTDLLDSYMATDGRRAVSADLWNHK